MTSGSFKFSFWQQLSNKESNEERVFWGKWWTLSFEIFDVAKIDEENQDMLLDIIKCSGLYTAKPRRLRPENSQKVLKRGKDIR